MSIYDLAVLLVLGAPQVVLFVMTIFLWIEVRAMQKSTHQISFLNPLNQQFSAQSKEEAEKANSELFDNIN